jgi:lycopene cyclase CruA
MTSARTKRGDRTAPDLQHFRDRYPLTVASLGALPDREAWLRDIWEAESCWRDSRGVGTAEEVVVRGAPPARLACEGEFEIAYAGAAGGLLDAALMATHYGRRVLLFDEGSPAEVGRRWGVSREEREGLARAGLFTKDEIDAATVNRYRACRVKFHDAGSRVKAPALEVTDVFDAELDADRLLASARAKLREREGCAVLEGARLVRAYVEPRRVSIEIEAAGGAHKLFAARLLVDATGATSAVARQLGGTGAFTHVSPSVGTVARGFARGAGGVDFCVREILVTTEDAGAHRQLLWNGSARDPRRDEFATRLFFYDAVNSPADKSLLALFESYFEKLPAYKRAGAQWRVVRPLYGYAAGAPRGRGWKSRGHVSTDRVLLAGGEAGRANPLAPSGAHLRDLERRARLVDLALASDALDARSLASVACAEPRASHASHLAEFLRPSARAAREPATVNETLNAVAAALHDLDESVRRELFRDQLSFGALRSLMSRTVRLYPRILQRVREHFGARGTFLWLAHAAEAALRERRADPGIPFVGGESQAGVSAEELASSIEPSGKDGSAGDSG